MRVAVLVAGLFVLFGRPGYASDMDYIDEMKDEWRASVYADSLGEYVLLVPMVCRRDGKKDVEFCVQIYLPREDGLGTRDVAFSVFIGLPNGYPGKLSRERIPRVLVDGFDLNATTIDKTGEKNFVEGSNLEGVFWTIARLSSLGSSRDQNRATLNRLDWGEEISVQIYLEGGREVSLKVPMKGFSELLWANVPCAFHR